MERDVVIWLNEHHGLISRERAMDLGLSTTDIRRRVNHQEWVVVRRGVYTTHANWEALDPFHARPLLRARAALGRMQRGWVLSHDSAAHAFGLDLPPIPQPHVHITRPGITNAWTKGDVKHHLAGFRSDDVVELDGLPCLRLARTAMDLAREHPDPIALAASDAALRRGVSRSALEAVLERMPSWPYSQRMRRSIVRADAGAETPLESLGRAFVYDLAIGTPETQFPLRTEGGVYWCDLRVGCHIFEFHGALKYQSVADGGVATRPAELVLLDERKRERLIVGEGLGLTNLYYDDLVGARVPQARARVLSEVRATVQRYGTTLPEHLAANAAAIRASHRRGA